MALYFKLNRRLLIFILLAFALLLSIFPAAAKEKAVMDQLNRKVVVPDSPERIVALAPSITEIVFALGQGNRLAGVTRFSDYPPEAARLPRVGSYVNLDLERIVALQPDLCIGVKDGNSRDVVDRLTSLGIPVYAVDPRDLGSVIDTIHEIGKLLNAADRADILAGDMQSRIDAVKSMVSKAPARPRVFFQIGIAPIVSAGTDTFIHELITLAGGMNLAQGPVPYPRFSKEQVLALSPDVFIITSMARNEVFQKVKAQWSRWRDMPAVRDDRIVLVDSDIMDRPTPRLVDGLEVLAKHIHPELFSGERSEVAP